MNTSHVYPKIAPLDAPENNCMRNTKLWDRIYTCLKKKSCSERSAEWQEILFSRNEEIKKTCNRSQDTWMAFLRCESTHDSSTCNIQPEKHFVKLISTPPAKKTEPSNLVLRAQDHRKNSKFKGWQWDLEVDLGEVQLGSVVPLAMFIHA